MEIAAINLIKMRLGVLFQFLTEVYDLIIKVGAQNLGISKQFENLFVVQYKALDEAIKKVNKSALTAQIQEVDAERDDVYLGMVEVNKGNLRHFDKNVTAAATRLKILFNTYGNIAKKPLNEQTALVSNILQELESKYAEDTKKVKIGEWVAELNSLNKKFDSLIKERDDETAAKSDVIVKETRKKLDESYKIICNLIMAFAAVENNSLYTDFIKRLNVVISRYGGKKTNITPSGDNTPDTPSQGEEEFSDVQLWDANEDYTKMKIGDKRKTSDGRIWEAIDLGQVHRDPAGEFGHFGWKEVK